MGEGSVPHSRYLNIVASRNAWRDIAMRLYAIGGNSASKDEEILEIEGLIARAGQITSGYE